MKIIKRLLWPEKPCPMPESFVEEIKHREDGIKIKIRTCGDFSRAYEGGKSPNDLINDEEASITGTSLKDLATLTLCCEYAVTADVCNAFRNLIANERWWRLQLVPVLMEDGNFGWSMAYTLEFGKKNASALWVHFYKMICKCIEWKNGRNLYQQRIKPCTAFGLKKTEVPPAKVKYGEEIKIEEIMRHKDNKWTKEIWKDKNQWSEDMKIFRKKQVEKIKEQELKEMYGSEKYNKQYTMSWPGNDPKVAMNSERHIKIPTFRKDSDWNKTYSKWREGGLKMNTMTLTIDDILFAGTNRQNLEESYLTWLEGHDEFGINLEFDEKADTVSTKAKVIGYELDFKESRLRVKQTKIKAYKNYWKKLKEEIAKQGTISVEDFSKLVGKLIFAASLDEWKMFKIDPLLRLMKDVFIKYKKTAPDNWDAKSMWDELKEDQKRWRVPITKNIQKIVDNILTNAENWTDAIDILWQQHDGGKHLAANTDASGEYMGGMINEHSDSLWNYEIDEEDKSKLPVILKIEGNEAKLKTKIAATEMLAVIHQVEKIVNHEDFDKEKSQIITMSGDNTEVIMAINKKRAKSIILMPFLKQLKEVLKNTRTKIRAVYINTQQIPADVLTRMKYKGNEDLMEINRRIKKIRERKDYKDMPTIKRSELPKELENNKSQMKTLIKNIREKGRELAKSRGMPCNVLDAVKIKNTEVIQEYVKKRKIRNWKKSRKAFCPNENKFFSY